jgi:hypothetical protein
MCSKRKKDKINDLNDFYSPENIHRAKIFNFIQHTFFIILIVIILGGCAGTGGYQKATFKDQESSDVILYGMFDRDYASKYFGSFRFVFDNDQDKWLELENFRLTFTDDSANKYIKVLDQMQLEKWGKAVRLQKNINESTIKEVQSAIISAGSSMSSMVGDISATVGLDDTDQKKSYPENHLYAEEFILPPGFAVEKWILLESSHHNTIPYVTDISLDFIVDNKHHTANLRFREESSDYDHFIWYDPTREANLNFYLGVSAGSNFPMGDFKEVANRKENIINSFGVNGYLAILNHFGINFALDYQSFLSRAKLQFRADSLTLPGTDFEFGDWGNLSLLISPRFVLPVAQDLELFTEFAMGVALSNSPTIIAKRAGLEIAELESVNSFSFAGGFALGSRFYLTDKFNLDIKLEFIPWLEPTFKYQSEYFDEVELTQSMSQYKIKASANWEL